MSGKPEKDKITGQYTTGHEWGGIKELNTPLPRWWVWVFAACTLWAMVYWVLMPAWPLISSYTTGTEGYSSRQEVLAEIAGARAEQGDMLARIEASTLEEIKSDPDLSSFAFASGRSAFGLHCSQCHGLGAEGAPGIANLNDDDWIWGGDLDSIYTTIRFGVRADHPETRFNEMPAFLRDEFLELAQVEDVADFVLTLSGSPDQMSAGGLVFEENCAMCHGPSGEGFQDLGGPRLNDGLWLYGGRREDIIAQISAPKHGMMPAWEGRLAPETIKKLAVYVHSLGGGAE